MANTEPSKFNSTSRMELGTGVFLGLALVAVVLLYRATMGRWRWKRIALSSGVALALPLVAAAVWFGIKDHQDSAPQVQTEFWELATGMPIDEVLFRKGKPDRGMEDGYWIFKPEAERTGYVVSFREGKVRFVQAFGSLPYMQGISEHSSSETIERKFGKPDHVSTSEDGSSRTLSYSKYRVSFQLEKNRVVSLGMFDPTTGPLRYAKERAASSP